jgi:hypothetical protein
MKYRIGEPLFRCVIDADTGRSSFDTYRVRSIRGCKVYAVQVNKWTWVRQACGKEQTREWAAVIDPVWRTSCREGERFDCLHRTKGAALRQARKWHAAMLARLADQEGKPDRIHGG